MCTVFSPAVGDFLFLDANAGNQIPSGWSVQTDSQTQIDFIFNGVVKASISVQSNENFEVGWPRWSPAGNFVAMAYGRLTGGARRHFIEVIDIRNPDIPIPPHLIYGGEATNNLTSDWPTAFCEMRATSDGEAIMCLVNLNGLATIAHQVFRTFGGNSFPICSFGDIDPIPGTAQSAGVRNARITNDSKVEIILTKGDGSIEVKSSCDLPRGELQCGQQPLNFPDVIIGGTPNSQTRTINLFNVGDDCIDVNGITNVAPFAVAELRHNGQVVNFPVDLPAGEVLEVEITFQPTAVENFGVDLAIDRNPPLGCNTIACNGDGVEGEGILAANPLDFGLVSINGPVVTLPLVIRNTGNIPVDVQVAAQQTGDFIWPALPQTTLQPNDIVNLDVTFDPSAAGTVSTQIQATSTNAANANNGTVLFSVQGEGCEPLATLVVSSGPQPFGNVERGFRAVRTFTLSVNGNEALNYRARIENDTAGLFGVQEIGDSLSDLQASIDGFIRPPVICGTGQTGSGQHVAAVIFWANGTPGDEPLTADLVVEDLSQNPAQEIERILLEAQIEESVAIDAALVLDRSGSMNDFTTDAPNQPGGDRRKVTACIQASHLFVDLLRPELADRVSVVRFNQEPNVLQQMALISTDGTGGNPTKDQVKGLINNSSNSLEPNGATGIAGGVLVGADEIARARTEPVPDVKQFLIVLTDGMGNRAYSRDGTWYTILGGPSKTPDGQDLADTVPLEFPAGVQVYAVGIGAEEDIDQGQLAQLSETTGGEYYVIDDLTGQQYFAIEKHFLQIFMESINWSSLLDPVYTAPIGAVHEHAFHLLKGDFGGLIAVFHQDKGHQLPFELISPGNELVTLDQAPDGFSLRSGQSTSGQYIEFRCPAGEPHRYAGQWKLRVQHPALPGSQGTASGVKAKGPLKYGFAIGAGSNFRMHPFLTPGLLVVGEAVQLTTVVTEVGLPVSDCLVSVKAHSPSGQTWDVSLAEIDAGEYSAWFPHTAEGGSYRFVFQATGTSRDGEPVRREAERSKYIQGRIPVVGEPKPTQPSGSDDDCCRRQLTIMMQAWRLLIAITVLLVVMLLVLLFT